MELPLVLPGGAMAVAAAEAVRLPGTMASALSVVQAVLSRAEMEATRISPVPMRPASVAAAAAGRKESSQGEAPASAAAPAVGVPTPLPETPASAAAPLASGYPASAAAVIC